MKAEIPPVPAENSKTYAVPRVIRWLGISSVLFCAAACVLLLWLPIQRPDQSNWLLAIAGLGVFGCGLYLSLAIVRRSRDTVAVADDGLWYHSPHGPSQFMRWDEIADVHSQNVMQRLVVSDSTRTRTLQLEFHLQEFGDLRRTILERATRRAVDG
jgi:hypothetical protein